MTLPGGGRRTARGKDLGATPWVAPESGERDVRCQLCGSMNRGPAGFCRWCGTPLGRASDPVLGTTTRRAVESSHRGSMLGTIIGILALVAVVGVTGWLFSSGAIGRLIPSAAPTPIRTASPLPSGSVQPSTSPDASPSATAVTPSPTPSVEPSPSESAEPSPTPTPSAEFPTQTSFSCDPATIGDPDFAVWRIASIDTIASDQRADTLVINLALRRTGSIEPVTVEAEAMPSEDVRGRFGINGPANDRAIVLTFEGPITIRNDIDENPGLSGFEEVHIGEGTDGLIHAVIGTPGNGCFRMRAPEWAQGSPQDEAAILVDIRD